MLKRIYIDNYKCLVNFDLPFQELTLMLGANGNGKSSVLDAVFAIRQLLKGVAKVTDAEIFPSSTLTRWQTRPVQTFEIDADIDGIDMTYHLEIEHDTQARRARIVKERLDAGSLHMFAFEGGEVQLYRDNGSEGPRFSADWGESALARVASRNDNTKLTSFIEHMRQIVVCGLYPRSFFAESTSEDSMLLRDGSNFSAWYRHVFQERQDLVPGFLEHMKKVIPGFAGIRLEKTGTEARCFMVRFDDRGGGYEVRLDEISDGQRALLALYSLITITSGQRYTLFLDEPDNYVALNEIQPWLVELGDACGEMVPQAVLTSHHPELIDYLGSDRGLMLSREQGGPVVVQPLNTSKVPSGLKLSEQIARGWQA